MPDISLWNITTGSEIALLIERTPIEISLPVATGYSGLEIELISGSLPSGCRLEGTKIVGFPFEVDRDTIFSGVLRATWQGYFDDRTLRLVVTGADEPQWVTPEGLLPVGTNQTYFILDSEIIDFQLLATDTDLPAGDVLEYFIADGDGVLPPGITLTSDGRLTGVTEPLLSLDKRFQGGGYDTMPYGDFPMDYATLPSNGFDSFFYDSQTYGYAEETQSLRKLNRYYPFAVTVTDGDTFVKREFTIYLVGDDYLRADNTVMKVSNGVFTADVTHIRTPKWITPRELGFKRANNYVTLYLDIINPPTLLGTVSYTLDNVNDDNSPSILPPGLSLDSRSGEITGYIPYQPAITENYKFTVRATRFTGDLETLEIFGTYYEDTLLGNDNFKVYKLDLTGNLDGINDLKELVGRDILLYNRLYTVINVDDRNTDYDIIFLNETIAPAVPLLMSRTAVVGSNHIFVSRLSESNKEKYQGRTLNFGTRGSYVINDITPYLEYEITQVNPFNDPILPVGTPKPIQANESYFLGDFAFYPIEAGGDGKIYRCTFTHTVEPELDLDGLPLEIDGVIQVDFISANWTEVAETIDELSTANQILATKQALEAEFGGIAYIEVLEKNRWRIRLRSTSYTRTITNVQNFFAPAGDSTQIKVRLIRDNEHRIALANNLQLQLNSGRNIGIGLFRNEFFVENIVIADTNDPINVPFKSKTFELSVIGEIDTTIKWLTDAYLGKINANYLSTFKVEAETTVPDTEMVYRIVSGKLPFGMRLNYKGEIIGRANQFATDELKGLTTFDGKSVTWDGSLPGDTTFDRRYKFTIEARDRFNYSAITREFVLDIEDLDDTLYTDIIARPMLKPEQRTAYKQLISNPDVFAPNYIYRPDDENFGIQKKLEMLVYAGIEATEIQNFVAAAAKNHKRKRYKLGNPTKAIARYPGTLETVYEVVYIPVLDPYESTKGKTKKSFNIKTTKKITADSIQYAPIDDETRTGLGYSALPVYGRQIVRFVYAYDQDSLIIETRDGDIDLNVDNQDFLLDIRDNGDISVQLQLGDSEPQRIRPTPANTIKADSNAVKVSDSKDQTRYISSVEHMRDNIKDIGKTQREYLPLWMRTPQTGFAELDYVNAIPICYCKPGTADDIILNLKNNGFDFKTLEIDIDRYIVQRTLNREIEQYILFANYQFNV